MKTANPILLRRTDAALANASLGFEVGELDSGSTAMGTLAGWN